MINVNLPEHIFLFGHRQQHGKDTSAELLKNFCVKNNIDYSYSFFARLLKKQVAERYNLDFEKMEEDSYKNWCPPWVESKSDQIDIIDLRLDINFKIGMEYNYKGRSWKVLEVNELNRKVTLNAPRTVRDILIEEGNKGRSIWENCWASAAYRDLFETDSKVGIISDYRFPNEYLCFDDVLNQYLNSKFGKETLNFNYPKVHRVLVHRPAGIFKNDGADGELPDLEEPDEWDYVIMNDIEGNGWKKHLDGQISDMLMDLGIIGDLNVI